MPSRGLCMNGFLKPPRWSATAIPQNRLSGRATRSDRSRGEFRCTQPPTEVRPNDSWPVQADVLEQLYSVRSADPGEGAVAAPHSIACELVRDLVAQNGAAQVRVYGCSMLPAVWPGDILHIQRTPAERLAVGQIVMFYRDGGLVAHRICEISRAPWSFITQGDHLPIPDSPVRPEELIGLAVAITRRGQ